jgi:hypothetical protein
MDKGEHSDNVVGTVEIQDFGGTHETGYQSTQS